MYTLAYDRRVEKDLRRIPRDQQSRILHRTEQLAIQPRHPQVEKLVGRDGYRLRVGDYRVLFTIDDQLKRVTVYRVKPRGEAYR
ncbi:MAG: hypothetical protein A3C53_02945 [Omnitrophica WOR_2 bacterium RIFCSPHIGHO2_02_FULL_68_15]|nr:MAG: hypothetical protein A3C53_02945 [Omnitrophica WOR_2 bacterium RIFCSPHIGHO2_02_FULL_68_15]